MIRSEIVEMMLEGVIPGVEIQGDKLPICTLSNVGVRECHECDAEVSEFGMFFNGREFLSCHVFLVLLHLFRGFRM